MTQQSIRVLARTAVDVDLRPTRTTYWDLGGFAMRRVLVVTHHHKKES